MAASLADAETLARIGPTERALLEGRERPIVLAPRRADAAVAPSVAPGAPELGVMLPYSPLHHLLLSDVAELTLCPAVLVMTSGNVSDEPIAYRDDDAIERLSGIADLLLVHDRPIETRVDDSVMRVVVTPQGPRRTVIRRSRGYVPAALPLPEPAARQILACGAEQKNTFCVARGEHAWVSHHIGDLENYETLTSFTEGIDHLERMFAVTPEVVVHDLHPEYLSTKYALERDGVELIGVQHHHAHLAAVLAEHGEPGRAVGAIYDGTGYGSDGAIWGGELLYGDLGELPARRHAAGGADAGRRTRDPAAVAHGLLLADGDQPGVAAVAGGDRQLRSTSRHGRRWPPWPTPASTRPSPPAWAGCSMPYRRCAACAPRSATRGRRRSSWRRSATRRSGAAIRSRSICPAKRW